MATRSPGLTPKSLEHVHQPMDAAAELAVIRAMQASVTQAADDLFVGKNWAARRKMLGIKSGQSIINPFIDCPRRRHPQSLIARTATAR